MVSELMIYPYVVGVLLFYLPQFCMDRIFISFHVSNYYVKHVTELTNSDELLLFSPCSSLLGRF